MDVNNTYYLMDNVAPGTVIRHYMSKEHLYELLNTGSFYIKRKKHYKDSHECGLPPWRLFDFKIVEGDNPCAASPKCVLLNKEGAKETRDNAYLPTSCWTEFIGENMLMWQSRQKSTSDETVCIKTTVHKLASALINDIYDVICLRIQYVNRSCLNCTIGNLYTKELAYAGEKEIRFYLVPKDGEIINKSEDHIFIKVIPEDFIEEVVLSPYFDKDCVDGIFQFVEQKGLLISKSKIKIQ